MTMDLKQEQSVLDRPDRAVAEPPAPSDGHIALDQMQAGAQEKGGEAIFDIADFRAIASFAGLRRRGG